jgi:hypothetical protein
MEAEKLKELLMKPPGKRKEGDLDLLTECLLQTRFFSEKKSHMLHSDMKDLAQCLKFHEESQFDNVL